MRVFSGANDKPKTPGERCAGALDFWESSPRGEEKEPESGLVAAVRAKKKTSAFEKSPNRSVFSCVIRPESWQPGVFLRNCAWLELLSALREWFNSNESRLHLLGPATFNDEFVRWPSEAHGTAYRAHRSIRCRDGCVFTLCLGEQAGPNSDEMGPWDMRIVLS
jgi:hypothetical protein